MEENKRISDLFERARTEAPKTSFEKVKGHFLATSAVAGTGIWAKWAAASFKFKVIVMISALSTLTISGVIIASQFTSGGETPIMKETPTNTLEEQNLEVSLENGVQKTIVYDDKDQVVEVIVDSSGNLNLPNDASQQQTSGREKDSQPLSTRNARPISTVEPEINTDFQTVENPKGTERRFIITEKTTIDELNEIQKLAEAAGVKMKYNARVKKSVIKRLSMTWMLVNEDGESKWQVSMNGDDDFSVEVGWKENEDGQATEFLNDTVIQSSNKPVSIVVDSEGNLIRTEN